MEKRMNAQQALAHHVANGFTGFGYIVECHQELQRVVKIPQGTYVLQFHNYSSSLRYICLEDGSIHQNQMEDDETGFLYLLEAPRANGTPLKFEDVAGNIPYQVAAKGEAP